MKPALLVMAAGMGSRYGGLKQIDSVGPSGETIIDYSIHDAIKAGFGQVVFIIRRDIEEAFKEAIGSKFEDKIRVDYVFQELDKLPSGYSVPDDRKKPWGTGHAILMAKEVIDVPFAVINGDDFYGAQSFSVLSGFLSTPPASNEFCMVGFKLSNTLSDHGTVTRGICQSDENDLLQTVTETHDISSDPISCDATPLTGEETASMNMWGFTPALFDHLEKQFTEFLDLNKDDPNAEYFIPEVISNLITSGDATVKVMKTDSTWLGITYQEDKPGVISDILKLTTNGTYPNPLW